MDHPQGFEPQAWLTSQTMGCRLLTQLGTGMPLQPVMDPMTMIAAQQSVLLKELYLITHIFCVKPPLQDPLRLMMQTKAS
eukprot:11959272-Ditylum_brightwellii.AAC.1